MSALPSLDEWTFAVDGWIIIIAALCACACAVPGSFLVVRRSSMMADAVSHAVLPGIAAGFFLSGTRDPIWMLLGATGAGLLVAVGSGWLARTARMDTGAALGICFTGMFALGLLLIVRVADTVDLDPSCVLYGAVELAPLDSVKLGWFNADVPRAAIVLAIVAVLNALAGVVLWKQLKLSAFDGALAQTLGCRPRLMESIVLAMAAATCVAAFESVGSILVVAMMIIPAATARLWSDRLSGVILGALVIGAIGAVLGHWVATGLAPSLVEGGRDASSAGSIAATLGGIFALSMLVSPKRGVLVRLVHRWQLTLRIAREDALGLLWRLEEDQRGVTPNELRAVLRRATELPDWLARVAIGGLRRGGRVKLGASGIELTQLGRSEGTALVRSHRLWEIYLSDRLALARDHVHPTAMQLEHITDAKLREQLASEESAARHGAALSDPHGRAVPQDAKQDAKN